MPPGMQRVVALLVNRQSNVQRVVTPFPFPYPNRFGAIFQTGAGQSAPVDTTSIINW
jgi:hypothetical protein